MKMRWLYIGLLAAAGVTAPAEIKLADAFSDHMVLQRRRPIPVWGVGTPGESVKVRFNGAEAATKVDDSGRWRVDLEPQEAGGPYQLEVAGNDSSRTVSDVLVGEVWLVSGQSNADMAIRSLPDAQTVLAEGSNPQLRIHEIFRTTAAEPQSGLITRWDTIRPGGFPNFSAVGYFFGQKLQQKLGVPVGIIGSTLGGSGIDSWRADVPGETLYNAMIHPLAPQQLAGVIWYQGEANMYEGRGYFAKLVALAATWRKVFENPELPFVVIELAPYNYPLEHPDMLPTFWEVQRSVAAADNAMMTVPINDLGDPGDIHPARKREVGERAAGMVLGELTVPEVKSVVRDGAALLVTFSEPGVEGPDSGFEIAGPDGVFHPASIVRAGSNWRVSAPGVKEPEALRYDWTQSAVGKWHSSSGMPLPAFRRGKEKQPEQLCRNLVPEESAGYQLVYGLDLLQLNLSGDQREAVYAIDRSGDFAGRTPRRVGYFLYLVTRNREVRWLWASVDAFSKEIGKLGLPTVASGADFKQKVDRLSVRSNVPAVKTGEFPAGLIEFYPWDYQPAAAGLAAAASNELFDCDDTPLPESGPGYGSMQLFQADGRTVFAFNHWRLHQPGVTIACDIGLGDAPQGWQPDWTRSFNWRDFQSAQLQIWVEFD